MKTLIGGAVVLLVVGGLIALAAVIINALIAVLGAD